MISLVDTCISLYFYVRANCVQNTTDLFEKDLYASTLEVVGNVMVSFLSINNVSELSTSYNYLLHTTQWK